MFDPQTKAQAKQISCILMCDSFRTHKALKILKYYFKNSIILCHLPFTPLVSFNSVTLKCLIHLRQSTVIRLNDSIEKV